MSETESEQLLGEEACCHTRQSQAAGRDSRQARPGAPGKGHPARKAGGVNGGRERGTRGRRETASRGGKASVAR
eukprot:8846159-Alexandrium_andersonii.AAC.1